MQRPDQITVNFRVVLDIPEIKAEIREVDYEFSKTYGTITHRLRFDSIIGEFCDAMITRRILIKLIEQFKIDVEDVMKEPLLQILPESYDETTNGVDEEFTNFIADPYGLVLKREQNGFLVMYNQGIRVMELNPSFNYKMIVRKRGIFDQMFISLILNFLLCRRCSTTTVTDLTNYRFVIFTNQFTN